MGFAGLAGGISGAAQGIDKAKETRIAASDSQIRKDDRDIRQSSEGREAEKHDWAKGMGDIWAARALVDAPPGQQVPPSQGQPPPQGGAIPGVEGGQPPPQGTPPQGTPPQGTPPQVGAIPGVEGGQPPPPSGPPSTRRERYDAWKTKADRLAFLTGGFDGLTKFNEMEDATSMRQIMGYGIQAANMMDEDKVGEAMRLANQAMESAPFDTGLKFQAIEGKLYMVGADGVPGEPLTANGLRAHIEDQIKTRDTYLAWKKQAEDERATGVAEEDTDLDREVDQQRADTADDVADIQRGWLEIGFEKLPSDISKTGAEIRKLLMDADSNAARAALSGAEGGLSNAERLKIMNDIPTLMQNAKVDPGLQWLAPLMEQPGMSMIMQSGMMDVMSNNPLESVNYADAIGLASLAYSEAAGITLPAEAPMPSGIGSTEDGRYYADFAGKRIFIPSHMYQALDMMGGGEEK